MVEIKPALDNTDDIPVKRYFTIGEVADLCDLKAHVLRYWEQEFPQLSPVKRRGNRRYYQRDDVVLIRHIRELLYAQGFTIQGARQQLDKRPKGTTGPTPEVSSQEAVLPEPSSSPKPSLNQNVSVPAQIQAIRLQLKTARALLKQ